MKNILLYILIGFTTMVFSQKEKTSVKDSVLAIETQTKNHIRQGNKYYRKSLFTKADSEYKKALALNPNYDKANYNFGVTQYIQNKIKEAKAQFELVSKITKDRFIKADSYHNLGNIAMKEKKYEEAVNAFKNSLRNNSKDDETRYNLALAQKLLKEQQQKDKDKDKKDDKKDDKKKDNKDKKDQDNKDKNKDDKKDKDKDKKDDKGDKDKDKKGDKDQEKKDKKEDGKGKNDKDKKEQQQPKPQQSKLSPDQVKKLLENMNKEENKTQQKMNAKKERGRKIKQEKDW